MDSPTHTTDSPTIKQSKLSPLYQIVLPKNHHQNLTPDSLLYISKFRSKEKPILRHPRKTKPIVWCAAIICMIISILIIFSGIATLIVFLAVQPRNPAFDAASASLGAITFNPPQSINGDVTIVANISNPNKKLSVRFEYLFVELYFSENLAASQLLQPFSQKPGESRLVTIHLLSSLMYPPPSVAMELQQQEQRNRVAFTVRGTFKVKVKMGSIRYSYWLHGECQLEMTSPPNGVLITRSCRTKR
ncbi:hypothetical protein ABFS82_13G154700 [Erythranthe guttata]|nr:PREDICTED: uncharacterized protein LOC105968508 [Erythranthe guttata]|eukprot:XP_012848595.1 PREDICTED: uncharacterized protein LOC105968508 [Erythranthe guttata]